jgi:hypothetical protein
VTTDRQMAHITELAEQLADPTQHTEPITEWTRSRNKRTRRAWTTTQPGLLQQLAEQITARGMDDGDSTGRPIPGSRPPLNLSALAVHVEVSIASSRWLWSLRAELRDTPEANVRALVGLAPGLDDDVAALLLDEMTTWVRWASVLTGWRSKPYRPRCPCPVAGCGKINTLVINLHRQAGMCTNCRTVWQADDGGLLLLGGYVRSITDPGAAA